MKLTPIKIKTKKSGFEDSFFVMIVLMGVILFILILSKVWSEMRTPLDEGLTGALPDGSGVNITQTFDKISSTTTLFDKLIPFLLIGLFGFILIGAAVYMQHPIMIFVGIIILAVAILLGAIYSNVYHQIAETDEFADTTAKFPISNNVMQFLPYIIFIMFIGILAAVIWSRKTGGSVGL